MKLNRRDIGYTIISRFEEAFRDFLKEAIEILFEDYQAALPSGVINKAQERLSDEDCNDIDLLFEYIDFPDLKEISTLKGSYKTYFNSPRISVEEFSQLMDELYELRCKIAHVRGIFTSLDLDKLSEISRHVAELLDSKGDFFIEFLDVLSHNPEQVVVPMPVEFECNNAEIHKILNNVPMPDYEFEGGFVGRKEDIRKLTKLIEVEQVVTIAGAGGVGKTSLASEIVRQFMKRNGSQFDGIIWLSAKENKLSYLGIEDVEPTVKNYKQLLDTVLDVMGFPSHQDDSISQKEHDLKIVSNLFKCILIVIDNLETIVDESIVDFLLNIRVEHSNIKILITSRRGLGQVERRYELKELQKKEAIQLFKLVARDKGLNNLIKLDEGTIGLLVTKLSCYPLAIKWMLGQVAIGKGVHEVIESIDETTSDISKFCFEQIYSSLSESSKKVLCTLSCFDDPPSAGVLGYVVDLEKDDLEDAIKDLILVSLVIPEQYKNEQGDISNRYILLPLTRGYVRQQLDRDTLLKRSVEERLRKVENNIEEAERASKLYRFNLQNMGAITEEEKVAAMIAQNAFAKYQDGRYIEAYEEYKRACEIAPRFASIYRNWAAMESQEGHLIEADKLMEKASRLSPDNPQIWLTWGNIKRKNGKINDALEKYEKAYQLDPEDPIILNSLGQAKTRSGDYEDADSLFRAAIIKEIDGSRVRHEIINLSSLAENLLRWGETLIKGRNYELAEKKYQESLQYCEKLIQLDKDDPKSERLLRQIYRSLGFFYKKSDEEKAIKYFEKSMVNNPRRYSEIKETIISVIQLVKLLQQSGQVEKAMRICSPDLRRWVEKLEHDQSIRDRFKELVEDLDQVSSPTLEGEISFVNLNRGFTIIVSGNIPGKSYFGHVSSYIPRRENLSEDMKGMKVTFIPVEKDINGKARLEAIYIQIV